MCRNVCQRLTLSPFGPFRGPRFFGPFGGPFSAVSKPIFANKYSFWRIFRDLQDNLYITPDFFHFWRLLHHLFKIQPILCQFSQENTEICKISSNFNSFFRISRIFLDFDGFWKRVMLRMQTFRIIIEIPQKVYRNNCKKRSKKPRPSISLNW